MIAGHDDVGVAAVLALFAVSRRLGAHHILDCKVQDAPHADHAGGFSLLILPYSLLRCFVPADARRGEAGGFFLSEHASQPADAPGGAVSVGTTPAATLTRTASPSGCQLTRTKTQPSFDQLRELATGAPVVGST